MNNNIIKRNIRQRRKNYLFSVFLFLMLIFFPVNRVQAWTGGIPGGITNFTLTQAYDEIIAGVKADLKLEAIKFVQQELNNTISMMTGTANSVMGVTDGFIEDWEAFLIEEPGNQVASRLEEFLFKATGGRTSSNYKSRVGKGTVKYSSGDGFNSTDRYYYAVEDHGASYRQEIKAINALITEERLAEWSPQTWEEPIFSRNPRMVFTQNDLTSLSSYFSTKYNNDPWSYQNYKYRKMENLYERKRVELEIRSQIGQGFWSESTRAAVDASNASAAAKGSLIRMLEQSDHPAETVVLAAAVKLNAVATQSITNIRKSYNKDLAAYRSQLMSKFDNVFEGGYPSDVFKEQIQDRKERHNEFNTGVKYDRVQNLY